MSSRTRASVIEGLTSNQRGSTAADAVEIEDCPQKGPEFVDPQVPTEPSNPFDQVPLASSPISHVSHTSPPTHSTSSSNKSSEAPRDHDADMGAGCRFGAYHPSSHTKPSIYNIFFPTTSSSNHRPICSCPWPY